MLVVNIVALLSLLYSIPGKAEKLLLEAHSVPLDSLGAFWELLLDFFALFPLCLLGDGAYPFYWEH